MKKRTILMRKIMTVKKRTTTMRKNRTTTMRKMTTMRKINEDEHDDEDDDGMLPASLSHLWLTPTTEGGDTTTGTTHPNRQCDTNRHNIAPMA